MNRRAILEWIWKLGTLACLLWIGYEVHQLRRDLPYGLDYQTEQTLHQINSRLNDIESNTRRR